MSDDEFIAELDDLYVWAVIAFIESLVVIVIVFHMPLYGKGIHVNTILSCREPYLII
jgi:hypothetical protein